MTQTVFDAFLATQEMSALLDARAIVQAMMDFEAGLARAQARVGLIPATAAQAIASLCRAELYDVDAIVAASAGAGSVAVPLVAKLTETVALFDPLAAGFVHWGCSSQDLIDTALVLQTRKALQLIESDLLQLCSGLLNLAGRHEATPMLGRTLMQPAQVTSLRFKVMGWLAPLLRSAQALRSQAEAALLLQLGGAVGTQAALGEQADAVARELASELHLSLPDAPWQVQRDRWMRLAAELGVLCGSLAKLATDLSLLAQAEVGELGEALLPGRGVSAAMPHKHNPLACMQALAAAKRAPQRVAALLACMDQEHERGLGGWPAELAEFSALLSSSHAAVRAMVLALPLRVNAARMLENIDRQLDVVCAEGLVLLLAPAMGRAPAQARVGMLCERALAEALPLRRLARDLVAGDAVLATAIPQASLEAVFDLHDTARRADARVLGGMNLAGQQLAALLGSRLP